MRNLARAIGLSTLFAFHPACGGSSDNSGGGSGGTGNSGGSTQVSSGLPPQTMVSDLTDAQATQLCNAVADATNQTVTAQKYCTFVGVTGTLVLTTNGGAPQLDAAACNDAVQQCLSSGQTFGELGCDSGQTADLASCDITVQQFQDCYTATLQQASALFGSLSCDKAPTAEDVSGFDPNAKPAACDGLDQKCPGAFGSGGSGSNLTPSPTGCDDTCTGNTNDGFCDDGGPGSDTDFCGLGTDCSDCGARTPPM